MRIHITLDSSFITGIDSQGREIKIPSYVLPKTVLSRPKDDYVVMTWPDGSPERGQSFLVGQAATFEGNTDRRLETWFEPDEIKVLVGTLCSLLANESDPITVSFQLPDYLYHKKTELISMFTNFKANYNIKGSTSKVHIAHIVSEEEREVVERSSMTQQECYETTSPFEIPTDVPTKNHEDSYPKLNTQKNPENKKYIFRQSIRLSHLTPEAEKELKKQKNKSKYIETAVNFYASHQRKLEELQSIIQTMNIRR